MWPFKKKFSVLPKFQVGDYVLCIKEDSWNHYSAGKIYTISDTFISTDKKFWFVRTYSNGVSSNEDHFVKIEDSPESIIEACKMIDKENKKKEVCYQIVNRTEPYLQKKVDKILKCG